MPQNKMIGLKDVQDNFQQHLLENKNDPAFRALIKEDAIGFEARLNVYRKTVVGGLVQTLMDTFPCLEKITGTDFTVDLLRVYVRQNPPKEGDLYTYGEGLSAFVRDHIAAKGMPYLPDIIHFEWLRQISECATDDEHLSAEDVQDIIGNSDIRISLRNMVQIFHSPFDIMGLWHFINQDSTTDKTPPDIYEKNTYALLYRPHIHVQHVEITPAEFHFLDALTHGNNLEKAIENILNDDQIIDINELIKKCFNLNLLKRN